MVYNKKNIYKEKIIKLISLAFFLLISLALIFYIENMLFTLIIAILFYYLLNPLVNYGERIGLKRQYSVFLIFSFIFFTFILFIYILFPIIGDQISSLKGELPKYIHGTTKLIADTEKKINLFFNNIYNIKIANKAQEHLFLWANTFFKDFPSLVSKSLTVIFLAPFLIFFMLAEGNIFIRKILKMVPNNLFELCLNVNHQINLQIGGYIRARITESFIISIVVLIGLVIIDFPYAPLIAIFAGITNLIPYIGPFIGAIPALIICLINSYTYLQFSLTISVFLTAQLIDAFIIIPLVIAKIVNLHPLLVILLIILGAQFMGILGMVIFIPIACAIKVSILTIYNHLIQFKI